MSDKANLVRVLTSATGNGSNIVLGAAYSSLFMTPAEAGCVDGHTYTWLIVDGTNFEMVKGPYHSATSSMDRTTVLVSRSSGTLGTSRIVLSGTAQVRVVESAADMDSIRGTRTVAGTTDAIANTDLGYAIVYTNSSPVAVSIGQAGASAQFLDGWSCWVKVTGAGTVTITPTTSTINGAASLPLAQNLGAYIWSDGTNYHALVMTLTKPLLAANNLSDVANTVTARTNIGAGTVTNVSAGPGLSGGPVTSSGALSLDALYSGGSIQNYSLSASASGNALTISVKDASGNDPSSSSPVNILFRNATLGNGTPTLLSVTAATSLVVPSGATLGATNGVAFRAWIVGFNDAGTFRLGVINCSDASNVYPLSEEEIGSSTAISASATAVATAYTGSAVTSKAFRVLGYCEYGSGLATAGTWASAPTKIQLFGDGVRLPGQTVQKLSMTTTTGTATTSSTFTATNLTKSISPTSAANLIKASASCQVLSSSSATVGIVQFGRNSNANMFGSMGVANSATGALYSSCSAMGIDKLNTTSPTTYTLYLQSSNNSASVTCLPNSWTGYLEVEEIMG